MLEDKGNRQILNELEFGQLKQYQLALKKQGEQSQQDARLVFSIIPVASDLSITEILSASRMDMQVHHNYLADEMKKWCEANGIGFQEAVEPAKVLEPSLFPLFTMPGNDHYSKKSADVIAFLIAYRFLEDHYGRDEHVVASPKVR
jgi:hypothetical protein